MWSLIIILLVLALLQAWLYYMVSNKADPYLTNNPNKLPQTKVAVLLGTSPYLTNGDKNMYFKYRMDAATELYESGKVSYILVSGDNAHRNYNEPQAMEEALIKRGIPKDHIILDYAGFRTLDSMVRAQKVFGQQKFIVVSQKFHNERAIYIARNKGIEAYGYNATDVGASYGLTTRIREVLARTKMMLDLYVLRTKPHFLGNKITIG